jgi:hypothetical protein
MKKKQYTKPEIKKSDLDYTISLQMQSQPDNPIRSDGSKSSPAQSDPFASPFSDKPFN